MKTTPEIETALAAYLLYLRPDWTYSYTLAAVQRMGVMSTDVERVTRVAIRGALSRTRDDWTLRKPDPLAMSGEHWKAQADYSVEAPRPSRCSECHDWHAAGGECTPRKPTRADGHIAELRAVHAEARQHLCPHGVPPWACADHRDAESLTPEEAAK